MDEQTFFQSELAEQLHNSLKKENGLYFFDASVFFRSWFKKNGTSYFFLFKKNIKETNIQFAELISLLRKFTRIEKDYNSIGYGKPNMENIQFYSTEDFKLEFYGLSHILQATLLTCKEGEDKAIDRVIKSVVEKYSIIFFNSAIFDSYQGSACVFYPPHLSLELKEVIGLSGYVHSCGYGIYVRRLSKSSKKEFHKSLEDYLGITDETMEESKLKSMNKLPFYVARVHEKLEQKKIFFSVYCHEDFDKYDYRQMEYLKNGLHDTKLYIDKFYMGNEKLVDVIQEIRDKKASKNIPNDKTKLGDKLHIPNSGDYSTQYKEYLQSEKFQTNQHTIFLIVDKDIDIKEGKVNDELFYILYDQIYINKNPIHMFGENKPAWIDHTTLPPTLTGAMMNLAMMEYDQDENVTIGDPFIGSGTTIFESFKYGKVNGELRVSILGGAYERYDQYAIMDNLLFFIYKLKINDKIFDWIKDVFELLRNKKIQIISEDGELNYDRLNDIILLFFAKKDQDVSEIKKLFKNYKVFFEFIIEILTSDDEGIINKITSKDFIKSLKSSPGTEKFDKYMNRLFIYLLLRVIVRHNVEIKREYIKYKSLSNENHRNAFYKEFIKIILNTTRDEISKLQTSSEIYLKLVDAMKNQTALKVGNYGLVHYKNSKSYSEFITLDFDNIFHFYEKLKIDNNLREDTFGISDASEKNNNFYSKTFDVLLTDPPYGFNTDEDVLGLAELYSTVLEQTIKGFKNKDSDTVSQIIMCLPKSSQTGRHTYFFTQEEFVKQQIIAFANKYDLQILPSFQFAPRPKNLFVPPYYWHSEKALKRSIIHFKFMKKRKNK